MLEPPVLFMLLVYLSTGLESVNSLDKCTKLSACSCQAEDGVIDLSPLATHGTTPKLQAKDGEDTYYYNPCDNFNMGTVKDTGVVQHRGKNDKYFALGSNTDVSIYIAHHTLQILLEGTDPRTTIITVLCDTDLEFTFVGEYQAYGYNLLLKAPEGCPRHVSPTSSPPSTTGLSIGTIVVIAFFALLVCYIAFGVIFEIFVRKNSGKQAIPNIAFWSAIPGLIKDGVCFTFTCGKRSTHYSSI